MRRLYFILIITFFLLISYTLSSADILSKTQKNGLKIKKVFVETSKESFNLANVRQANYKLSKTIGIRVAGSANEHTAANYIEKRLKDIGYTPQKQAFKIVNGSTSYNVITIKEGQAKSKKLILGAHYDSKSPSPGANDNGTGSSILLELARLFKNSNPKQTLIFIWFGSEEVVGSNRHNHHFGSRYYAKKMSSQDIKATTGMISVDMVGNGNNFHVRSMGKSSMSLVNKILDKAKQKGYPLTYLHDKAKDGLSDHESFELAGIPSAWIQWRDDPVIHSAGDNFSHVQWNRVNTTGKFLADFLESTY